MTVPPSKTKPTDFRIPNGIEKAEKDFLDCKNEGLKKLQETNALDHFTERVQILDQQCTTKVDAGRIMALSDDKLIQLLNSKQSQPFYQNLFDLLNFSRIKNILSQLEDSYVTRFADQHFPQFLQLLDTSLGEGEKNGKPQEAANRTDELILKAHLNLQAFKKTFDRLREKYPDYVAARSSMIYNDPRLKKIDADDNNRLTIDELKSYLESIDEVDETKKNRAAALLSASICYTIDQKNDVTAILSLLNLYSNAPEWFLKKTATTIDECLKSKK